MYKIRKVSFINHPVLKNLTLDFCDRSGNAIDTIILAGENGVGKSTVLECLYSAVSYIGCCEMDMEIEYSNEIVILNYRYETINDNTYVRVQDGKGMNEIIFEGLDDASKKYGMNGIYSDVGINFDSTQISSVTSLTLDSSKESRRSAKELPTKINQLLIDIQALDDSEVAYAYRRAKEEKLDLKTVVCEERMPRFTKAFNKMFTDLTYNRVINDSNKKHILFQKGQENVPIQKLSSGEKQIVYRGCFLLQDVNAMRGATVFIDEPEISLHPSWQMKVMDYYKSIFQNENGKQTSQIFAVTHSPFIIHNENRKNDKVIILERDNNGDISVKDKPEYYKCLSMEAIEDAFSLNGFSREIPTVYVEGRTDEYYFNKTIELFEMDVPFRVKWIGYIDDKGNEVNTGKDSINRAIHFLIAQDLPFINVCLLDCDTNRKYESKGNVIVKSMPTYDNYHNISVGIENALVLNDIDICRFRDCKKELDGYVGEKILPEFKKMECCKYICSLEKEKAKMVLRNLKSALEEISENFNFGR